MLTTSTLGIPEALNAALLGANTVNKLFLLKIASL
jgi:hypothetical protein